MDLAQASNQPKKVEIDGSSYIVGRFTFRDLGKIEAYLKTVVPNPLTAIIPHLAGLGERDRQFLLAEARRDMVNWPPDVNSEVGRRFMLGTVEGHVTLMAIALQKHHPELTDEAVRDLHTRMFAPGQSHGMGKLDEIFRIAFDAEEQDTEDHPKENPADQTAG